jgi:acetyl-CoA C-acetyltransferase
MRLTARHALKQAGKTIADVDVFDLYSCFPSAVQLACKELRISPDDPRGLTVTGGLPYFGGPGNNYVTHAIAEMVRRVRAKPGSYGLIMANGGLVTKESVADLSTDRPRSNFTRADSDAIQREIDAEPKAPLSVMPQGEAEVETYAVLHGRNGPESGVLFGRLKFTGERFVANTPADPQLLARLEQVEGIGLSGNVQSNDGRNVFTPKFEERSA